MADPGVDYELIPDSRHVRCLVCQLDFTSAKMYDEHARGKNHLKKKNEQRVMSQDAMAAASRGTASRPPPGHGPTAAPSSPRDSLALLDFAADGDYTVNELGVGRCSLCDVELSSSLNTEQHLEGKKHLKKKQERDLLASLGVVRGGEGSQDTGVSSGGPVNTTSRVPGVSNAEPGSCACAETGWWCDVCSVPLNSAEQLLIHKKSDRHQTKEREKRSMDYFKDPSTRHDASTEECHSSFATLSISDPCPWKCHICDKKLNTGRQLRIHLETTQSHAGLSKEDVDKLMIRGAPRSADSPGPASCDVTSEDEFYKGLNEVRQGVSSSSGDVMVHGRDVRLGGRGGDVTIGGHGRDVTSGSHRLYHEARRGVAPTRHDVTVTSPPPGFAAPPMGRADELGVSASRSINANDTGEKPDPQHNENGREKLGQQRADNLGNDVDDTRHDTECAAGVLASDTEDVVGGTVMYGIKSLTML